MSGRNFFLSRWLPIIWSLAAAGAWTLRYNLVDGAESGLQAGLAVSTALLTLVSLAPLLQRYIATHRHWLLAAVLVLAIWGGFLAGMAVSEAGLRIGFPVEVAVPLLLVGYGVLLCVIQSWLLRRVE